MKFDNWKISKLNSQTFNNFNLFISFLFYNICNSYLRKRERKHPFSS